MSTSKEQLASKVIFNDISSGIPENYQVPTAISGVVVIAEKGPIGEAVLVTSEAEYYQIFGGFSLLGRGAEVARGFFGMGGKFLYVVRTCHYTDPADPLTATAVEASGVVTATTAVPASGVVLATLAAPYSLAESDNLDIVVDGGAPASVFFGGFAAMRMSAPGPVYNLLGGENIQIRVDGGEIQNIILDAPVVPGAMTAEEFSASVSRYAYGCKSYRLVGNFVIESDTIGTDSSIEVVGGSATGVLTITVGTTVGIGNVGNIRGVTAAEVKSVIEAGIAGVVVNLLPGNLFNISTIATGILASVEVQVTSLAGAKLGLDNLVHVGTAAGNITVIQVAGKYAGAYGNVLSCEVLPASSGVVTEFNLNLLKSGVVVERYPNLSMVPTDSNYFVSSINLNSNYIEVADPGVGTRPTNGISAVMSAGNDGLVGITDADYIGTLSAENALYAFENVNLVNLLAIPGVATPVVHNGLINYCEIVRSGLPMAFLEGPQGSSATQIKTYVQTTASLLGLSECGSIFWPWCNIANPNSSVYGSDETIVTPPSAIMMGRAAMTDIAIEGGIYQAPSGLIYGVLGIVLGVDHIDAQDERKRDIVYPCRINPIRKMEGTPYFNDGSRTLKESGMYPAINQKRARAHIESELGYQLEYVRHLRTNKKTRREAARVCTAYLTRQCKLGAFNSDIPEEAFTVDVGDGINPPSEEQAKRLNINLSFILAGAYEWVIVNISKKTL